MRGRKREREREIMSERRKERKRERSTDKERGKEKEREREKGCQMTNQSQPLGKSGSGKLIRTNDKVKAPRAAVGGAGLGIMCSAQPTYTVALH